MRIAAARARDDRRVRGMRWAWPLVTTVRSYTFETVLELASGSYRKQLPEELRRKFLENDRDASWPLAKGRDCLVGERRMTRRECTHG